jgi:hypothetical protein
MIQTSAHKTAARKNVALALKQHVSTRDKIPFYVHKIFKKNKRNVLVALDAEIFASREI